MIEQRWKRSDCTEAWQLAGDWGNIWVANTWGSSSPVDASQNRVNVLFDVIWCVDVFRRYRATDRIQQIASRLITHSTVLLNPCHEVGPPCMTASDDRQHDQQNGSAPGI